MYWGRGCDALGSGRQCSGIETVVFWGQEGLFWGSESDALGSGLQCPGGRECDVLRSGTQFWGREEGGVLGSGLQCSGVEKVMFRECSGVEQVMFWGQEVSVLGLRKRCSGVKTAMSCRECDVLGSRMPWGRESDVPGQEEMLWGRPSNALGSRLQCLGVEQARRHCLGMWVTFSKVWGCMDSRFRSPIPERRSCSVWLGRPPKDTAWACG